MLTDFVDDWGRVVLDPRCRQSLVIGEDEGVLFRGFLATLFLLRLGDRRDQLGSSATPNRRVVSRLAVGVQMVVPLRRFVRGVQNRLLEKPVTHRSTLTRPLHFSAESRADAICSPTLVKIV